MHMYIHGCCFPSCALLDKAMLSVDFFAEVKKFCIFLTASECFLPFASAKADQAAVDNASVLLHTEHRALILSFRTQSLRSGSLSQSSTKKFFYFVMFFSLSFIY